LLNAAHRIVRRLREFLNGPVVERLTQVENQIRRLEQLIAAVNEKTDVVLNRTSRFLFPVDDNLVLVRSMVGYLYCSRNDHAVLSCLAESGEFEPGLRRLLERVLEPGMVFLDVGAHLGLHTLAAARRVGKSGRVFSFEPTPTTYKFLCQTLRLNALDDCVTARRAAVGREDTTKPLYVGTISGHNSLYPLPGVETTIEVEVVQLDDELPPEQHVDVAKIDVEGAELDVLCGMSRIIAENPGILIIAEYGPSHLARAGIASPDWLSVFSNQEFKAYVIEEPSGHCVPIEQVDLSDVFSVNIAFIRPTSPLLSPLEANVLALPAVVVIGAGGHAKVVVELIRAQGRYDVVGCTDPAPERGDVVGAPILGSDDILPDLYAQGVRHCFVALGDNPLRMKVARRVTSLGFELINAISPNAIVSPTARLGHGVAVMAGAVINAATVVEDLAIINTHSVVDHDCQIGEAAHVAPRAALAGGVRIGPLAFVGAGATIVPGVSVGESSIIGAGATVISSLGPNLVAVGVPARSVQRPSGEQKVDHGKS
jgi:UDP-perosamine 4-acetyltransferase